VSRWVLPAGRRALRVHLIMGGLYIAAALLGRMTTTADSDVALVWPAAGVGMVWVFYAARERLGTATAVIGVGIAAGVLNGITGAGLVLGLVFAVQNAWQTWCALCLFRAMQRRFGRPTWWRIRDVRDAVLLGATVTVGVASGLVMGPLAVALIDGESFVSVAAMWLLRNVAGALLILPLAIRLWDPRLPAGSGLSEAWRLRTPEVGLILVLTLITYGAVYGMSTTFTLSFLPMGLTVWAAVRLDTTVAALHSLLASTFIIILTLGGRGPFASLESMERTFTAQAYVVAYLAFTWLIATQRDELAGLLRDVERSRTEITQQSELLRALFTTSADAITVFDATGHVVMRNEASRVLFDGVPDNLRADASEVLSHFHRVGDHSPILADDSPILRLRDSGVVGVEVGMTRHDREHIINVTASALPSTGGTDGGSVIVARDVTEARAAQAEVRRARDDYAMLLAAATEQAILACSPDGTIRLANQGAQTVLGLPRDQLEGRSLASLHQPEHLAEVAAELGVEPSQVHAELARLELSQARRWQMAGPGAAVVSMTVTSTPDGGFLCVAWDVTSQVQSEEQLRVSEARFRQAFDTAPISMFIVSLDQSNRGMVMETNSTATVFVGRDRDTLHGSEFTSLLHEDDVAGVERWLDAAASGARDHIRSEVRFTPTGLGVSWGLVSASVVHLAARADQAGSRYLLCLVEDITARRAAEDALVRQALHDDLTDLPNRVLLNDRLEFALRSIGTGTSRRVGVMFCDLDGFKDVNDAYGHSTGDEVLREVARRFSHTVGLDDTVARLGGDEFGVVRPDLASDDALADLAQSLIDSLKEPILSTRGTHHLGVSIGMVSGGSQALAEDLLAQADAAMYEAKREGKNRVNRYDATLLAKSVRTTRLLPELTRAFENGELLVHGQPVVSLRTGAVESLEMLLRWHSPDRGLIGPGEFLDVLEASTLMVPVGTFVLRESCRIAAALPPAANGVLPGVHVNVSGRQLTGGDFIAAVHSALEESGLDPGRLVLELTETHMPQLTLPLLTDLGVLRDKGVRIALDDLGTGYSSLARLTELPIDVLKVDRGFVSGIGTDDRCDAVVRAVVGMGDAMDVDVVAEGVETSEQAAELVRLGCPLAQGFLYSRPLPEADLADLVTTLFDVTTGESTAQAA